MLKPTILVALITASMALAGPVVAPTSLPEPDRAWLERFRLFRVGAHYGLNYWSTCMQITLFIFENGPKGNELGHDNLLTNLEAYVCPCVAKEDRRLAAGTIAFQKALASYVLASDPYLRRKFFLYFAEFYHAGGNTPVPKWSRDPTARAEQDKAYREALLIKNSEYAKQLELVWRGRTIPWMKAHGLDAMKTYDLKPFTINLGSGSIWTAPTENRDD